MLVSNKALDNVGKALVYHRLMAWPRFPIPAITLYNQVEKYLT
jgi:hypothetical protein